MQNPSAINTPAPANEPTSAEWAWLAGIIEGEGYFDLKVHTRKGYVSPAITVNMTDEDIIRRIHRMTARGTINGPEMRGPKYKPIWSWRVGNREEVKHILTQCVDWFGQRRGDRARFMIANIPDRVPYPVERIRSMRKNGDSLKTIAKEVKICESVIQRICIGKRAGGFYRQPLRLPS